jgi:hypothetical protein
MVANCEGFRDQSGVSFRELTEPAAISLKGTLSTYGSPRPRRLREGHILVDLEIQLSGIDMPHFAFRNGYFAGWFSIKGTGPVPGAD